ncbi:MAG: UDP-N-acetylglucosamine 2-epimerase (hydrolyzing) [Alphaproteobacteria bacterium]|nr:UDP-N-acetylglucosamine 2-epimerase (hydrolyzing) [Candidatus Parcubacteria bacterium]NCQ67536.1 UDP-N-acetylglucosamine 2-epimerase (hydrolyzing) [Alphaproteobacteria bacterium]
MSKKRSVAVFTGNRAEYGLLYPLLKELKGNKNIDFRLMVSGAHLDPSFGNTIRDIEKDGLKVDKEIKISLEMSCLSSTSKAIGSAILSIAEALEEIKPDIFVVYADRFEGFAATIAASQMSIPTAHIEGGDITEGGAFDDSVRHAMTKLAHLHFTTNSQSANRVIGMGEEPWRVHNVGFTGIDLICEGRVTPKNELIAKYNLDLLKPIVLFTLHSVGVEFSETKAHMEASLVALKALAEENIQVLITYPNNDVGSQEIIESILTWQAQYSNPNVQVHKSLGQANYYGILALAKNPRYKVACVGNSSSGLKETPAFLCPTVNIGTRQRGRLCAENVLDANYSTEDILEKVKIALFDKDFREICAHVANPYGKGNASKKMVEILSNIEINPKLLTKKMTLSGVGIHV